MPKFKYSIDKKDIHNELRTLANLHDQVMDTVDRFEDVMDVVVTMTYFFSSERLIEYSIQKIEPAAEDYDEFLELASWLARKFDYNFGQPLDYAPILDDIKAKKSELVGRWGLYFNGSMGFFYFGKSYHIGQVGVRIGIDVPHLPPGVDGVEKVSANQYEYSMDEGQTEFDFWEVQYERI